LSVPCGSLEVIRFEPIAGRTIMSFHPPAADTERAGLRGFLKKQLDGVRDTSFGLTEEQIRLVPSRSALSIGGLLKHVAMTTDGWIARAAAAPDQPPRKSLEAEAAQYGRDFLVTDTDTLGSLVAALDAATERALAVVDSADLDARVPVPDAPWFPKDFDSWSVRWVILHLIQETARHAGHADIIREHIDGATMYPLVAAAEGIGDTPFLKAWRPAE
jgi:uncharacterized damage-inducible protein DinB